MQEIDATKATELEEKYDPEMRFRPLAPPASLTRFTWTLGPGS